MLPCSISDKYLLYLTGRMKDSFLKKYIIFSEKQVAHGKTNKLPQSCRATQLVYMGRQSRIVVLNAKCY